MARQRLPGISLLSHNTGHLWETLMGWKGDPHLNPLHLFSDVLIIAGFILLAASLEKLYKAQRTHVGGLVLLAGAWAMAAPHLRYARPA